VNPQQVDFMKHFNINDEDDEEEGDG